MMHLQQFTDQQGRTVDFIDHNEMVYSQQPQPRDIEIKSQVSEEERPNLQEEICIDIRRGMGLPDVGIAQKLLWS